MLVPSAALTVVKVLSSDECITILVKTRKKEAHCPVCRTVSRRVQSRYWRILADVPWQGTPVKLQVEVKRFFCDGVDCRRRIFAERLPEVAAPYARQTCRLTRQLQVLGLALGGEAGKRLAGEVGIRTSADQLLRQVIQVPDPPTQTPRALGVDDWAFCRGRNYGTILIDLEKRRGVDLLVDRKSETLQTWLESHPRID